MATVAESNHRACTDRVAAAFVDDTTTVRLADGLASGRGVVVTRRNDRRLATAVRPCRNGTRWTLTTIRRRQRRPVAQRHRQTAAGPVRVLKTTCAATSSLGYATTITAQGLSPHPSVGHRGMTRESLHVG
jgi:hypothetical protein